MLQIDGKYSSSVAIVVVGFNRLNGLKRLLYSLERADYPNEDIPLVISIDCSGNHGVYDFVREYRWPHGKKFLNIQEERLGLKNHIIQCGDLTKYFEAVILLEDDLYVSSQFYNYTLRALEKYGNSEKIAQIALYKNEMNGYVGLPLEIEASGYDSFLIQATCSWGECWNRRMWKDFKNSLPLIDESQIQMCDMPKQIKGWTRAWSKFFYTFIINADKYVLYPMTSLTTNFNDAGGEHGSSGNFVQVPLLMNPIQFRMPDISSLSAYDVFYNNLKLYKHLGMTKDELCLDIYGFNPNINNRRYLLSTKQYPFKIIREYGLDMRPIESNILCDIPGKGIFLYDTTYADNKYSARGKYSEFLVEYFCKGLNPLLMLKEAIRIYYCKAKGKLSKK